MNRPEIEPRILGALQLQPMTVEQLATCLSLSQVTVRRKVMAMHEDRHLRRLHRTQHTHGRPWPIYSLTGAQA